MPLTVAQILTRVRQSALSFEDCVEIITQSACDFGRHPHVHLQDIATGHAPDQHLGNQYLARPTHSMWKKDDDAVYSLVYGLNSKAGEFALTALSNGGNNSRATIYSRSGAYWVSGEMQERHGPGGHHAGPGYFGDARAAWCVTVLHNGNGNLELVTHYPCAGGGRHTPPGGQDSVEHPNNTYTDFYAISSWSGTGVRVLRWFRGFTQ